MADVDDCRSVPIDGTDGAHVLEATLAFLRRYVVFRSEHQAIALALWVAHTHAADAADVTPYLAVTSPEKRSGKTRLLDVLELLVARAWRAVAPSEPVVYRKIEADAPTLLLDEVDTIFGRGRAAQQYEGLRALLNAGYRRGSKVPRCVGEGRKVTVQEFEVFCPKALAGIGDLPDTVADRSIPIRLSRRAPTEPVERFRYAAARAEANLIREAIEGWVDAVEDELRAARPVPLERLNDRAAEAWEPLIIIADAARGDWPRRARAAAIALSGDQPNEETLGVQLLHDVRTVLIEKEADRIASSDLASALGELEESPWGNWHGRSLDQRGLARLLRPFDVRSRQIRIGTSTVKGYTAEAFEDAFARYLAPINRNSETLQVTDESRRDAESAETTADLPGDGVSLNGAKHDGQPKQPVSATPMFRSPDRNGETPPVSPVVGANGNVAPQGADQACFGVSDRSAILARAEALGWPRVTLGAASMGGSEDAWALYISRAPERELARVVEVLHATG